jgi:hypothetical protein
MRHNIHINEVIEIRVTMNIKCIKENGDKRGKVRQGNVTLRWVELS